MGCIDYGDLPQPAYEGDSSAADFNNDARNLQAAAAELAEDERLEAEGAALRALGEAALRHGSAGYYGLFDL